MLLRRVPIRWRVNGAEALWHNLNRIKTLARSAHVRQSAQDVSDGKDRYRTGKTADRRFAALPWELHRLDLQLTYACEKEKENINTERNGLPS